MQSANRVVMNTGFLYGKMLITILISLYTTRLVLNALGATDYGVFNLVGGVVAILSFLNSAMANATQRYMSFCLGEGNSDKLKSIFSSSVILHLLIGIIIALLLEFGGILLFNGVLNIPAERLGTARLVFHFMVVSTFFTINAVPYDAAISAHENFLFDALSGILESILKLVIATLLLFTLVDKLILYGLLMAVLTILIRVIKSIYCYRKYEECRIRIRSHINIKLTKEMLSFAGWNLFGSFCTIARNQGLAIILNHFLGIIINAAYAIAGQVNSNLLLFSVNMLKSINPQIIKSEGSGDRQRALRLTTLSCKLSLFLLAFLAIPVILEMSFLLKIWLKTVPENTLIFCQLMILLTLLLLFTAGLNVLIQAVGRIKMSQTVTGSLLILNIPLSYFLIKLGLPAYSVLVGSIFLEIIAGASRIWFSNKLAGLNVKEFLFKNLFGPFLTLILTASFAILPRLLLEEGVLRAGITVLASSISLILFGKYIALTSYESSIIKELIITFYSKTKNIIKLTATNKEGNNQYLE
jgi:O-antigen/teichoic acid export membrane protein